MNEPVYHRTIATDIAESIGGFEVELSLGQTVVMPTKVILDVDTGTDDAIALMVAAL